MPFDVELMESPDGRLPAGIVVQAFAWASTLGAAPLGAALADGDPLVDGRAAAAVGPPWRKLLAATMSPPAMPAMSSTATITATRAQPPPPDRFAGVAPLPLPEVVAPLPPRATPTGLPFTPRARKALRLAGSEAKRLKRPVIGAEHLLLGLLREGSGVAAQALKNLGFRLQPLRVEISEG